MIGAAATLYTVHRTTKDQFKRRGRDSLRALRHEIKALRDLLQGRLDNPHDAPGAPGGKRYELGRINDTAQLATTYVAVVGTIAELDPNVVEDTIDFYVNLLNARHESIAGNVGVIFLAKETLLSLIAKADKSVSRIDQYLAS